MKETWFKFYIDYSIPGICGFKSYIRTKEEWIDTVNQLAATLDHLVLGQHTPGEMLEELKDMKWDPENNYFSNTQTEGKRLEFWAQKLGMDLSI